MMINRLMKWFRLKPEPTDNEPSDRIAALGKKIGYEIPEEHHSLFKRALRHRSLIDNQNFESHDSYERLEFLGDAVLDLITTEILFEIYPTENEGFLTKMRAKLVRGDTLYELSRKLEINKFLEVSQNVSGQGIELSKSVLSDLFEALVAAIYISGGYEKAFGFVQSVLDKYLDFDSLVNLVDNHKSLLMEYSQSERWSLPRYEIISESGPGHDKIFNVAVYVEGKKLGEGTGKSKKSAEQKAAKQALTALGVA